MLRVTWQNFSVRIIDASQAGLHGGIVPTQTAGALYRSQHLEGLLQHES
jgi:hypothetical protein